MSKPAAVLFDMDGVLIQSREVIERAWTLAARDHGVTLSAEDIAVHVHGRPGNYTLHALFGAVPEPERRALKQRVDDIEETSDCELTEGVFALLNELGGAGISCALVTSSWPARIRHVLEQHGLGSVFRTIVHREDVTRGKPDAECYVLAARRLGAAPASCIAFEDSRSGVVSAVQSGAFCIGIGDDTTLSEAGARVIKPSFAGLRLHELTRYLHPES